MNPKKFFHAVLLFFILTFTYSDKSSSPYNLSTKLLKSSISVSVKSIQEYTYTKVFKDGIWWVQVYDEHGILIDEYPL